MNCKPGDLAVVVGAKLTPELIGAIVRVVRPALPGERYGSGWVFNPRTDGPFWVISGEGRLLPTRGSKGTFKLVGERPALDSMLRPIRDQPGADETLTWAGLPAPIKTPEHA